MRICFGRCEEEIGESSGTGEWGDQMQSSRLWNIAHAQPEPPVRIVLCGTKSRYAYVALTITER
jgi:hypothetical protein